MTKRHLLVLFVSTILFAVPVAAQDVSDQLRWGRPLPPRAGGACFYKHPNFKGDAFCLSIGQSASSLPWGFNNKISSIRLFGRTRATIFNDKNFKGKLVPFERDVLDLKNLPVNDNNAKNWNDRISSILVTSAKR